MIVSKTMEWNQLNKLNCPKCGLKLKFRIKERKTNIRAREGHQLKQDMYFCFRCDFQISEKKLFKVNEGYVKTEEEKMFDDIMRKVVYFNQ